LSDRQNLPVIDTHHLVKQFPQCVLRAEADEDAFCEDKYTDDLTEVHTQLSKAIKPDDIDESTHKIRTRGTITPNEQFQLLALKKQCSPFHPRGQHMIYCALVKRECAFNFQGQCIASHEIHPLTHICPGEDVCRVYEGDARMVQARCLPFPDAICRDRYWYAHYEQTLQEARESPLNQFITSITFRFCDPFKANAQLEWDEMEFQSPVQLECHLKIKVIKTPKAQTPVILAENEYDSMQIRMRRQFPELYRSIYSAKVKREDEYDIDLRPGTSQVRHHFCPSQPKRLDDVSDVDAEEPLAYTGQVCRQLSRTLSRCLPAAELELPASTIRRLKRKLSVTSSNSSEAADIFKSDEYAGFCLATMIPGQYCIAGSPEIGVICPQGKKISCARPRQNDPDSWDDLGDMPRCIQHFGNFPAVSVASKDPFRRSPVMDLFGQYVEYGYFAQCAKLSDETHESTTTN
jgi:hypothetical protein